MNRSKARSAKSSCQADEPFRRGAIDPLQGEPESRGVVAHVVGARHSPPLVAREQGSPGPGAVAPTHGPGCVKGWSTGAKSARVVPVCSQSVSCAVVRTRSGTHGRKSPEEVGECVGADEGSSPLGKASRAYRPLASERAAHSAPHTKRVDNTRTLSGAHTQMGSSPGTLVVSRTKHAQHRAQRRATRVRRERLLVRSRLSNFVHHLPDRPPEVTICE